MGFFDVSSGNPQVDQTAGTFFGALIGGAAQRVGINVGGSSQEATKVPSIGGVPTQIQSQPIYKTGNIVPFYKKPIVIIGAAVAVALGIWYLVKGRK